MKFYTINQNNSGGFFIENDDVHHMICVEASSAKNAESMMERITAPHSDYCECCGERWYISLSESDGFNYPTNGYGENLETCDAGMFRDQAIIYYASGEKKIYDLNTKEYRLIGNWI